MRSLRSLAVVLTIVGTGAECGGDGAASAGGDTPWVTQVDSAGDTVRIRISREIPASLVRTIVAEMEVGAEDGADEETFGWIVSVVPTGDGGFLAYDDQASAIRQFNAEGAFVRNIGRKGGGPGEFGQVNGIARHLDGRIVVWDGTGARLNVYSDTGSFEAIWRVPFSSHFGQNMLWTDHTGRTYSWAVLERDSVDFTRGTRGVIVYNNAGKVVDSLPYPTWREPAPSLIARSADKRGASSYAFPFWPSNVAVVSSVGGFVSGPGDPYVFYLTHRDGARPVRIERETTPVPVSATERKEQRAIVEYGLRQLDPNWSWTVADIPANKPAYEMIHVAADGRIWVQVSTAAEPIPTAEMPAIRPGDDARPRRSTRTPTVFDVFAPEGRLLGRVAFPRRVTFHNALGNQVYAVRRDSLDVEHVVRYKIEPALPR